MMAKYYVTSGYCQFVTTATDPRGAALWAVHQFLDKRIGLDAVDWNAEATIDRDEVVECMLRLADTIAVSEIGFCRDDAAVLDTVDVLTEWNQLVLAIQRMASVDE